MSTTECGHTALPGLCGGCRAKRAAQQARARRALRNLLRPGEWMERALCAQTDPEVFFPMPGASAAKAKAICMQCPVRAECLDYALTNNEADGIWAGTDLAQRRAMRKWRQAS